MVERMIIKMLNNSKVISKYTRKSLFLLGFIVLMAVPVKDAYAAEPLVVDSRIRTLVYNENEVYRMTTDYGYQSNIVFSKDERVRTLSIGDSVPFKVTPAGNRIFVKTLQRGHLTNMTIVTNKRVYQFELSSIVRNPRDIIYVMRFFYPQEDLEAIDDEEIEDISEIVVDEFNDGSPVDADLNIGSENRIENLDLEETGNEGSVEDKAENAEDIEENYSYSISGPDGDFDFSPTEIYDNGSSVYLKFAPEVANIVNLFEVNESGTEVPLSFRFESGYVVVDKVLEKIAVRLDSDVVCVYNDSVVES